MSEALSQSTTFQALVERVAALEAGKAATASPNFTGTITFGDNNFAAVLSSGNAIIEFDAGALYFFDRGAVTHKWTVGGSTVASLMTSGFGVGTKFSVGDTSLSYTGLLTFADNAAAISAGAAVGTFYKTATGQVMVRY